MTIRYPAVFNFNKKLRETNISVDTMKKRLLYATIYLSLLSCLGYGCLRNVSVDKIYRENQIEQRSVRVISADYLFAIQEGDPLRAH